MEFDADITEILTRGLQISGATFAKYGINYALIGGFATGFRSQARFTKDLDFLLQVPQLVLPKLLEDLQANGFAFDLLPLIREWTQHHMVVMSYDGVRIDWLKSILPTYQHVIDRSTAESFGNQPVRIATAEGLILLKLLAFRSQDVVDIENLVAAAEGKLDLAWIRAEWQTIAGLDDPRMKRLEEIIG